jgi:leader peptidase (prepilin peptidase)/N-methyltransferase
MADLIVRLLAIPLGLVVGSFLTMVIDRVPDRLPIFAGGPRCPHCEHPVRGGDLIPVVSWMRLKGACRHCREPLTVAYPVVEALTAAAFLAIALRFGAHPVVWPFFVFVAALVALSVIDVFLYLLPDRIIFTTIGVSLVLIVAVSFYLDRPDAITRALIGSLAYGVVLFVPWLIKPNAIGFGDVKLALLLGLFLGWLPGDALGGIQLVLYALLMGCVLGVGIGGTLLLVTRRTGRVLLPDPDQPALDRDEPGLVAGAANLDGDGVLAVAAPAVPTMRTQTFPFGPALALGAVLAILFSHTILGV